MPHVRYVGNVTSIIHTPAYTWSSKFQGRCNSLLAVTCGAGIHNGGRGSKYDPSGIVCLIAGFAYGPAAAAIVSVLGFVPHVFMDPWGTLMAVLVALTLSVPAALIYRHVHTRKGAVIGLVVGALLALVAAIAGNLVITPIYTGWPVSEVAAIIVPALLPFNLIKFVIHGVVTFLVYKPISNLLNR